MKKNHDQQKGQTLLIVVFAMSLGLLVIVNTASRVVASVARTTQTNNYQKATAAAEGGVEIYLTRSLAELSALAVSTACPTSNLSVAGTASFPTTCIEDMNGPSGESRAFMGVETYPVGNESLNIRSKPGETIHVNLQGLNPIVNTVQVCWKGLGIENYSASYYFMYDGSASGGYTVEKSLYTCVPNNPVDSPCVLPGSNDLEKVSPVSQVDGGYWCYYVSVSSDPIALRIFTFPDGAEYRIIALRNLPSEISVQSLPSQGYRITALGEVKGGGTSSSLDSKKATRKRIIAEKTFPYPVGQWWDFAVTSARGMVSP